MKLFCTKCRKGLGKGFEPFCGCGGFAEIEYDLRNVELQDSPNPYVRFADLLPVTTERARLPEDARYTPAVHAKKLGARLKMPSLYLKDETVLPTRTTKDRMAAVSLGFLRERGVRSFCTSSTGNSSTAYANAVRAYPDMDVSIFTAESFLPRVQNAELQQVTHFAVRDATFVDAFDCAGAYARDHGSISDHGFFNPGRREGLKLAFFEATEQIPPPIDWYVQAVSSAMGVYGTYKGAKELRALGRIDRLPKLLCVQQESCAPMAHAFQEGSATIESRHVVPRPKGIAEAILRGNPSRVFPHVRGIVMESGGDIVSASESEIREARTVVEELEGISVCFSAAAAVAGLMKQVRAGKIPLEETVLVNLTGGVRPAEVSPGKVRWMARENGSWREQEPGHCQPTSSASPS